MKNCCRRSKQSDIVVFNCPCCQAIICNWHVTIWTDGKRCPYCFNKVLQVRGRIAPEIIQGGQENNFSAIPICIIIDGTYIAGAQKHVLYLLETLARSNFACYVISLWGGGRWFDNFRHLCVSMLVTYGLTNYDKDAITKFIGKAQPAVINTHLLGSMHTLYALGFRDYIATIHSFLTEHEMPLMGITDKALAVAKLIITPSNSMAKNINTFLPSTSPPIFVLPNCVDTEKFTPQKRSHLTSSSNCCKITFVGRLDSDKIDFIMLISTLLLLEKAEIVWSLNIVGDGELKDKILRLIRFHGIEKNIVFHGFKDNVSKFYANADIVFFPSANEGLSMAALEAMAMGKVVVATDVGDMTVLGHNSASIIVPPRDAKKAAQTIQMVIQNPTMKYRIEKKARQLSLRYSVKVWANKIISLFKNAI